MSGFAGVIAVVLAQVVAGSSVITWATPLWHETKRSYFTIHAVTVTLLFAVWAWWAASRGALPGDEGGLWSVRLALVTLAFTGSSALAFLARMRAVGRLLGILSAIPAVGTLAAMAATARQPYPVALFQLLAGAAFLAALSDGLFLGHWYLTDRKLTRRPIQRATDIAIAAAVVELVAIATGGFSASAPSEAFNPLLTAGALAPWIGLGMAGTTLLIAILVKAALRGQRASAVQSATGFYYLGVVTAMTAEVAVKTRFFPI